MMRSKSTVSAGSLLVLLFAASGSVRGDEPLSPKSKKLAELITFTATVEPSTVRPGQIVTVTLTGTPKKGYHTYPITQAARLQSIGQLSKLQFELTPGLQPLWPLTESKPEFNKEVDDAILLEHAHEFTWKQDVLVFPEVTVGPKTLTALPKLMVCDDRGCVGPAPYPPVSVTFNVEGETVPLTPALQDRLKAVQPEIELLPEPKNLGAAIQHEVDPFAPEPRAVETKPVFQMTVATAPPAPMSRRSLFGLLVASMGGAVGMLLTPCVFPMIPITVSFFLKQSEKKNYNALLTAGVYSLTIIVVLAASVLLLGKLIIVLANNPWLNLGLGLVLMYFAFSLFGAYEIELPSFLSRFTSANESQGGYSGAFFMALTFTITSFTCTGPFLGPLLVTVKTLELTFGELVLSAFAYSTTFAAPFFLLALYPSLLKSLPKGGNWMNVVKVVMGFLELGAALKFLGNTDIFWHPGNPWLFNYDTVLCAWIALSVACGLYLLGVYRLPHDYPQENLGVPRMLLASVFFGFAMYMAPALWRQTPQGIVGEALVAFLPLDTRAEPGATGMNNAETHLAWHLDYQTAWQEAVRDDKLIFVDFTGVTCTNCRSNEKNVFILPDVQRELAKYVRVKLYTDSVPDKSFSSSQAAAQAQLHGSWQEATFNNVTQPYYAVVRPAKDQPVVDGKLSGTVVGRYENGLIRDPKEFTEFLARPGMTQVALGHGER